MLGKTVGCENPLHIRREFVIFQNRGFCFIGKLLLALNKSGELLGKKLFDLRSTVRRDPALKEEDMTRLGKLPEYLVFFGSGIKIIRGDLELSRLFYGLFYLIPDLRDLCILIVDIVP